MSQLHGSLSGWYTSSYSNSFRTSRLRAPSLVPSGRVVTVAPIQQTLVVDLARNLQLGDTGEGTHQGDDKTGRRRETIFGPDVGEDDAPGWTRDVHGAHAHAHGGEEVGVDVVKGWVEKAKSEEGLHATTTLQALVNLKRPTLLLQQLEIEDPARASTSTDRAHFAEEDITASPSRPTSMMPSAPLHLLKFNYDATTPQVRVQLEIYPTPQPAIDGKESIAEEFNEPRVVYSGIHPGGFNQLFTLPATAALDLSSAIAPVTEENIAETKAAENKELESSTAAPPVAPISTPQEVAPPLPQPEQGRRGLGGLFRRNRQEDIEAAAGVPIEMTATGVNGTSNADVGQSVEEKKDEIEQGMRLLISINGIGHEGQPIARRNAQLTHILVSGMWVPDAGASTTNTHGNQHGKRVWVVKVVRREALIGKHTFLLKEIYGLSASSTSSTTPSYPPTSDDPYASTPNECIVCLTAPRDVVLLPCRHLVVCRECAVGMVEFGAGGKVARREDGDGAVGGEAENAAAGDATGTGTGAAAGATPQVAGGTTTTGRERRKKKVKGWYCPVCRQPYTSLLRLALPEAKPSARAASMRAPSIRSVRTMRSTRSLAPTLPEGAERMLEGLRPAHTHTHAEGGDEVYGSDDEVEEEREEGEGDRPQFVLGPEVDAEENKGEVEHRETITPLDHDEQTHQGGQVELGQQSGSEKKEAGGWKEVI